MPDRLGVLRRTVRELGLTLITLGVVILLFVAYQLVGTNFTEEHNQVALAKQFHATVATAKPAAPQTTAKATPAPDVLPSVPPGGAIDHLVIPAIGVNKFVVEGTDEDALRHGPGHYPGTAYPGQVGNTAIAGHRTTYGAPFFELNELKPGDPIELTDLNDHTWIYVVSSSQVVSPDNTSVLDPTTFAQLTLTTCNPRYQATQRLVVFARLKGRAGQVVAPANLPSSAGASSSDADTITPAKGTHPAETAALNLGHGESGAWLPSIGFGALVVLLWILARLTINRTRRWYRLGAYVVGIGVCLIPLWFCFENVVLLLPQSI